MMISVRRKLVCILTIFIALSSAAATITEGPVSVSALVGENAVFHCAGTGAAIVWMVDKLSATNMNITNRGIVPLQVSSSGNVQSSLTVPATIENNGTTVHCVLYPGEVTSSNATLTVLSGIGTMRVTNVRFNPSFNALLWDPPVTAGVLSDLSYIVTVVNNNTGDVIVSDTTTNTQYPLPVDDLQFCQFYKANVTVISGLYGDSAVVIERTPGDYYNLANLSQPVVANYNITHSAATFAVNIQRRSLKAVCPDQELSSVTYPVTNSSNKTPHTAVAISQPGLVNYTIFIEKNIHYSFDIIIGIGNRNIEMMTVLFSSYDVQQCDVHSDLASILVECIFAINSTEPGIAVIQNEQGQTVATRALDRLSGTNKGSVNITGLPTGNYRARVFDQLEDPRNNIAPAYEHDVLITIIAATASSPVDTLSDLTFPSVSGDMISNSINITPSSMPEPTFDITATLLITASVSLVVMITIIIIAVVLYINRKYSHCHSKTSPTSDIEQESTRYVEMQQTHVDNDLDPTYMEPITNFLPTPPNTSSDSGAPLTTSSRSLKPTLHYAQVQLSANHPTPAPPAEHRPVNYATVQKSATPKKYDQDQHSGNTQAALQPVELNTRSSFSAAIL